MKYTRILPLFLAILLLSACGLADNPSDASSSTSRVTDQTQGTAVSEPPTAETTDAPAESSRPVSTTEFILRPPVEDNPPNTDYEPAFTGQTRAPGVVTTTPYEVVVLTDELESPWAVAALPDGRLVVTEKAGQIRIVSSTGELSLPIGGFPSVDDRGQGGLLDVLPSPDFSVSRLLYFTLAEMTGDGSLTAVVRGRLSADERSVEQVEIIWRAIPYYDNSMHFGSRIVFDKRGHLLFPPANVLILRQGRMLNCSTTDMEKLFISRPRVNRFRIILSLVRRMCCRKSIHMATVMFRAWISILQPESSG